jgi:hypothetical protein
VTAITRDKPFVIDNPHDAHVRAKNDHEQREIWADIKKRSDAFEIKRDEYWDNKLQDALSPPRPQRIAPAPPVADTAPVVSVEPASDGPAPLSSSGIAASFEGLRSWDLARWKQELSSPDKWLKECQHSAGTRGKGGRESTWWPVAIATTLVQRYDATPKSLSARFKNREPLKPWRETWQPNDPDSF